MKRISPLILFICLYLFIWVGMTLMLHSSTSISLDTAENIIWGMHPSLMYDKHPGLGQLFFIPFYSTFSPLLADLIAVTVCILITWYYLFKINRLYFDTNESMFVTLLSILSFFYMGEFFIQYKQNIILLPVWCASAFYFIKAIETNKIVFWILTAIAVALSVYAKFQIALLAISMLLYIAFNFDKKYLSNITLAVIIGTFLLVVGFISLYDTDFSTITYVTDRVSETNTGMFFNIMYSLFDSVFQW